MNRLRKRCSLNRFKDCEVSMCEQRSDEWFDLRRGNLTASNFAPWLLTKKTVTARKARESAICKLIAQAAGAWEKENFATAEMQRGTDLEPEAVAAFEKATGLGVTDVGFCQSIHGSFGCSPDGLIDGRMAGLEGKCPIPGTHIKYRRAAELPNEYIYQVHGSMAVTGATSWWFQSYNPGLAPYRMLVERDAFTEELHACLREFSGEFEEALLEESSAWQREFGKEVAS